MPAGPVLTELFGTPGFGMVAMLLELAVIVMVAATTWLARKSDGISKVCEQKLPY